MKTAEQGALTYISNSIRAYLAGEKNCTETWLIKVAGAVAPDTVRKALAERPHEPKIQFLRELYNA